MCVCVGGGVAKCSDLNARCSLEKKGLDWDQRKGFMFFAAATSAAVSHPACYPAVTDGFHTRNNCPGLEVDVSTACSTDAS
jgi:hypothetical protein